MWSDKEFRVRVARRCAELRISQREALQTAGIAHDYLQTVPAHGRQVDKLAKLAEALDWSLAEIMGLPSVSLNIELLLRAYRSMERVARSTGKREVEDKVWILAMIYNVFDDGGGEFADSKEDTVWVEQTVCRMVTNPQYVDRVQKKIQRFQQVSQS